MKRKYLILLLFVSTLFAMNIQANEVASKKIQNALMGQNSLGRLFYVTLPPNDSQQIAADALEIFVSASENTTVTLSNENTGLSLTKPIKAYKVTRFSSKDGDFGTDVENFTSGMVMNTAMKVESPTPISVYVINAKPVSSDGYMAIPVSSWGTRYIHLSYWDFKESRDWKTGFIVMASENNTRVQIQLKGRQSGQKTDNGRSIGQSINVTLNKGQTYMVRGDGTSRGAFDLSGSEIIANKKIALIGFHERCMIPVFNVDNGRDHICEMMPPVQAWGKRYVSVELRRKNYGDYFRVITSEENTTVKYTSYDIETKEKIEQNEIVIPGANEFVEYKTIYASGVRSDPSTYGIRGSTIWESDKPIFLMHYSCSEQWDAGGALFDPDMMNVTAAEQYTTSTIFQTPQNFTQNEFRVNYLNLIAIGDTTDQANNSKLLQTVKIDDVKVSVLDPKFLLNRVPGTEFYFARISIEPGPHKILGDAPFGGYIYGFSYANGYAWPAASAYRKLGEFDTLPPVPKPFGECGEFTVPTSELRDGADADNPRQIDSGVDGMPQVTLGSFNFEEPTLDPKYSLNPARRELFEFKIKVKDKNQDGVANIRITDAAGNDTLFVLRYEADSIIVNPNPIDFGKQRIKRTSNKLDVEIKSNSDSLIYIKSIKVKKGDVFVISDPLQANSNGEIVLQPRETRVIKMTYRPIVEFTTLPLLMDLDSLIVETKCLTHAFPIIGKGVVPRIVVEDYNAGTITVDKQACKQGGFYIINSGTDTLTVTAVDKTTANVLPFDWDKLAQANYFPFKVAPNQTLQLTNLCVQSALEGVFRFDVKFLTDIDELTAQDDDISIWRVDVRKPGPAITSELWDLSRLKSVNTTNGTIGKGFIYLSNTGSSPFVFNGVELADKADVNFRVLSNRFSTGLPITVYPAGSSNPDTLIAIPVQYTPQTVGKHTVEIRGLVDATVDPSGYVSGNLDGTGFLPQLSVSSYTFTPACLVTSTHQTAGANTEGVVRITNTTQTVKVPVNIFTVQKDNSGNPADFTEVVVNGKPWNTINATNPLIIPADGTAELKFTFTPSADGLRNMMFNVYSDAGEQKPDNSAPKDILNQDGKVFGTGFVRGLTTTNINYGNIISCDNPIDSIRLTNTSLTEDLNLSNLKVTLGDGSAFKLINTLPAKLLAGGTYYIKYQLVATTQIGLQKATYTFDVENLAPATFTIEANIYKVNIEVAIRKYPKQNPGVPFDLVIDIGERPSPTSTNIFGDAKITSFTMIIKYKKNALYVMKNGTDWQLAGGSALAGKWKFLPTQLPSDNDFSYISIVGAADEAGAFISKPGILISLNSLNMLSETGSYIPEIASITLGDNDQRSICVDKLLTPGLIGSEVCAQPIRAIDLTAQDYQLYSINPNPISTNTFDLKFDVGLQSHTKIEIVNATGAVVNIPVNQLMADGKYAVSVNTENLGNGVYYVKMKSGFYEEMTKLIISK